MTSTAELPGVEQAVELGLTEAEYERIVELMGRSPNQVELAMFSLLWSEHCAYKHSRKLLGRLPTEGDRVVMGPGENAGAVDVGNGHAVAFKVESHNHPSAVEPFQGAATGVGGILRDVFAIGARPIAVLDSLRFGEPTSERSRYLFEGAVAGIGHYGNSIGVPTVGGEVYFEPPYEHNCLVNAMCVGLARTERMIRSAAAGPGNLLVIMGASTGRDGIGGASVLASAELEAGDDSKRPSVQIGDPFEESKLLECCLELLERDLLVSLQDLGAAGLTSSAGEMASKGGVGIDIDVARVPLREPDLEPFEVMISESQERMLAVVEPSKLDEVVAACERWQTGAAAIGEVTDSERLRVLDDGLEVGDVPVSALVDECPLYDLEPEEPGGWMYGNTETLGELVALGAGRSADPGDPSAILCALLASSNVASKRWAFEQYDSVVGSRTARRPEEADAAVLMLPESGRAIAVAIDCNGRRVACDPYAGTVEAVIECAQNLACVGAEPLGLTNCLNFGNPEKPNVAWQLDRAVLGPGGCLPRRSESLSSAATSRSTTRPSTARSTRPRSSAWSGSCRTRSGRPGWRRVKATGWSWWGRSLPRLPVRNSPSRGASSTPGCRRSTSAPWPRLSLSFARPCATAGLARPTTSATGVSPARWPRWRSRPAGASRRTSIRWSSCAEDRARAACSGRGRGGSSSASRPTVSTTCSRLRSGPVWKPSRSPASAGTGSRSRPPSGTSPWRWPTRNEPGARCRTASEPSEYQADLRGRIQACSGDASRTPATRITRSTPTRCAGGCCSRSSPRPCSRRWRC